MALRSGYKGFKKLLPGLKLFRPGTLGIDNDVLIPELNKNFFPRSEQAVLGAKNLWDINDLGIVYKKPSFLSYTILDKGYQISNEGEYDYAHLELTVKAENRFKPNQDYVISTNITIATGMASVIVQGSNTENGPYTRIGVKTNISSGKAKINFNIGTYSYIQILLYCTYATAAEGNVTYDDFMITLASDLDDTYVPYAMTNRELTEKVQGIIDAATNAADFAAFKAAMEAITPVTRSLSKEAFPEDVPEVIEEKKPVTKKTIKKTVKEGE